MQVITGAPVAQFLNALGLNRRVSWTEAQDGQRVHQIGTAIDPTAMLSAKLAKAYWAWGLSAPLDTTAAERTAKWYAEECKVRLALAAGEVAGQPARQVGGYVVLQGELLAFHNMHRGVGAWMLDHAVNDGAKRLSCLDVPHLLKLYGSRGFKILRSEPNFIKTLPRVVWMER